MNYRCSVWCVRILFATLLFGSSISAGEPVTDTTHHDFLRRFTLAQRALRRYVLAHVPDFHQAEDVMQEVAVILWDRFEEFQTDRSFEAWAIGIARNKVFHVRRTSGAGRLLLTGELSERFAAKLQNIVPQFDQRRGKLKNCLQKLAERARKTNELRYGEGFSTERIALETGGSVNAVRILLCRTRRSLARCITSVQ